MTELEEKFYHAFQDWLDTQGQCEEYITSGDLTELSKIAAGVVNKTLGPALEVMVKTLSDPHNIPFPEKLSRVAIAARDVVSPELED